jgi:hypothetical protein
LIFVAFGYIDSYKFDYSGFKFQTRKLVAFDSEPDCSPVEDLSIPTRHLDGILATHSIPPE